MILPYAIGTIYGNASPPVCLSMLARGYLVESIRIVGGGDGTCEISSGAPEIGALYPRHDIAYQWTLEGCYGRIVNGTLYIATNPESGPLGTQFRNGFRHVVISGPLSIIGKADGIHVVLVGREK